MSRFIIGLIIVLNASQAFPVLAVTDNQATWWRNFEKEAAQFGYGLVTVADVKRLITSDRNILLIDARPNYEYQAGHLPDAINVEFDLGDRAGINPRKKKLFEALLKQNKDRPIVIYCRGLS